MDKQEEKYQIILTFNDKDLANAKYLTLLNSQYGFRLETRKYVEPKYCIVKVAFSEDGPLYTYGLSDSLAENIQKGRSSSRRTWPTTNGLTYGTIRSLNWYTKAEINAADIPFDKIRFVDN